MVKGFQMCAIVTAPIVLICHAFRLWIQPCVPFAPGFWILSKCSHTVDNLYNWGFLGEPYQSIFWTTVCYLIASSGVTFFGCQFLGTIQFCFVVASCIRYYLNNIFANIQLLGTNQLAEMKLAKLYKELQILLCYFNKIHEDIVMSTGLYFMGVTFVIGIFALMTNWETANVFQFIVMTVGASQSFVGIMALFGTLGGIFVDSVKTIGSFNTKRARVEWRGNLRQCKVHSKIVKSLKPLKIKIGSVNFVDRLTPVTFIDFCFGILVNMLLLK